MKDIVIKDVRCIITAPEKINLLVVRVDTSEAGLYGYGCATFTYRSLAVKTLVEQYLKPLLVGRSIHHISELWQLMYQNAYWRNDAVSANAISGVDMALWDIKGKLANMPLYALLGGRVRAAVPVYCHASGRNAAELQDRVRHYLDEGVRYIRVQLGTYGGLSGTSGRHPSGTEGEYYDPRLYMRATLEMIDSLRRELGDEPELLHDVHERLSPADACRFACDLDQYRLFFLEDIIAPEQSAWLEKIRALSSTPLALGELFTHPLEWDDLIRRRLIDFIRVHISMIGGITPAVRLAHQASAAGIRTAWHGPGDLSPVGHAVNVHLDLCMPNFGIQEWTGVSPLMQEVFPGSPRLENGFAHVSELPGIGVDLDEKLAADFPPVEGVTRWTQTRLPDGSLHLP